MSACMYVSCALARVWGGTRARIFSIRLGGPRRRNSGPPHHIMSVCVEGGAARAAPSSSSVAAAAAQKKPYSPPGLHALRARARARALQVVGRGKGQGDKGGVQCVIITRVSVCVWWVAAPQAAWWCERVLRALQHAKKERARGGRTKRGAKTHSRRNSGGGVCGRYFVCRAGVVGSGVECCLCSALERARMCVCGVSSVSSGAPRRLCVWV